MKMILIFTFLGIGLIIGIFIRKQEKLISLFEKLTSISIYTLLFLLGLSIGSNDTLVAGFGKLGWQAIILSTAGITGSIFIAKIAEKYIYRKK